MPQLGETVTEGTITRWLKAIGDTVERDEPLFEVSTDKVDSEVPAPSAGTLTEIRVPEGDTVDVGVVLAVIGDAADGSGDASPPGPAAASGEPVPASGDASPPAAVPSAAPSGVVETAPPAEVEHPGTGAASATGLVLSPVVRRLLQEHGIDASEVPGTGVGGRITRSDVLRVIDERRAGGSAGSSPQGERGPAPAVSGTPAAMAQAPPAAMAQPWSAPGADTVVPFTNIRRRTAEHMVRSKATAPHALVVAEADFEPVEQVRSAQGERFRDEEGFSLTYLPFVARAAVEALHEWPHLNASVGDDSLVVHHRVHLAIAVDLAFEGLIAPVVHDSDELTVRGLARRIHDLATRARTKKLGPDNLAGGTFTITNPGPFGTLMTFPVINQPQVAILSTDGVKRKPVVLAAADGSEAIGIHSVGLLSLAWDHRAVDGAYAAAFVRRVAELVATHDWSAEL